MCGAMHLNRKKYPVFFFCFVALFTSTACCLPTIPSQCHLPLFFFYLCLSFWSSTTTPICTASLLSLHFSFFSPACLCSTVALATCGPRFVFPIFVSSLIYSVLNRCFFFILPFGVGVVCFLYSFCFSCVVCDC